MALDDYEVIKGSDLPIITSGFETFYIWGIKGTETVRALMSNLIGPEGKSIELQKTSTYIQWRKIGDTTWNNLVALSEITGATGKNIELQKTATYVQWRNVGETTWNNLISLTEITGSNGKNIELQKTSTYVQWRNVGDTTWNNLVALSELKGETGAPGKDFVITAYYSTYAALIAAVPNPAVGANYGVGSTAPYDIWTYSLTGWVNNGTIQGPAGASSYVYVAYASDTNGTGFSLSPGAGLNFFAIKQTTSPITSPTASDFTGLWQSKGSVTSVSLSLPGIFSLTGSPVTSAGTFTVTLASQTAKYFFAAPNGANGAPIFRLIVASDLPDNYGDNKNPFASKTAKYVLAAPNGAAGAPSFRLLVASDLPANHGDTLNPYASKTANYVLAAPNGSAGVPVFRLLDLADIPYLIGYNSVTTLSSLPVTKQSIYASVTVATTISLASALADGRILQIKVYNTSGSAITQPLPTTGSFESKKNDGTNISSVSIPAGGSIEISIWAANGKYIIKTDA